MRSSRCFIMKSVHLLSQIQKYSCTKRLMSAKFANVAETPAGGSGQNIGKLLLGSLKKKKVSNILDAFSRSSTTQKFCAANGIDANLREEVLLSFSSFCQNGSALPPELHLVLYDVIHGTRTNDEIFPLFLRFAKKLYPHIVCVEELKNISKLRNPANWYPKSRAIKRKIVFHTLNSKCCLEDFMNASSGLYCGPCNAKAFELYEKVNKHNINCDLVITGEQRKYSIGKNTPAKHLSCTVEMAPLNAQYEYAIIDDIQQISDPLRGWAWTRALMGLVAKEVHVFGEPEIYNLLESICVNTKDTIESSLVEAEGSEVAASTCKQACLQPPVHLIKKFASRLPDMPFSYVINKFLDFCTMDETLFFLCDMEDYKFLAKMIDELPLAVEIRHTFCSAPIRRNAPLNCAMFVRFALRYSCNMPVTFEFVSMHCSFPPCPPENIQDLMFLKDSLAVTDLYIWLSHRFPEGFPDVVDVIATRTMIKKFVKEGVHFLKT